MTTTRESDSRSRLSGERCYRFGVAVAEDSWLEYTLETLRQSGYRSGGARTAVIEVLAEQDCCLGAQEIFDLLRERGGRKVGIASVYRVLELLASLGLVQRVELGAVAAR